MLGSPVLYPQIEERLIELLGCEDALVIPTITLIHLSVIPVLAGDGTIFVDNRAHKTIYDGCQFAVARGATVKRFRFEDPDDLEQLLRQDRSTTRLDLHGRGQQHDRKRSRSEGIRPDRPPLRRDALRRRRPRVRSDRRARPRGTEPVRHPRQQRRPVLRGVVRPDRARRRLLQVVLVARSVRGLPDRAQELLKTAAPPYLYSGPSPIASLATVLAGFDVNEARGDAIRADLWRKTDQVLHCLDRLGIHTPNRSGFPIIEVPLARHEDIDAAGRFLFDHGVYVTLAAYPLVPKSEVGFRIQVTAANSQAEIEQLDRRARQARATRSISGQPKPGIRRVTALAGIDWRGRAWVLYLAGGGAPHRSPTSGSRPSRRAAR